MKLWVNTNVVQWLLSSTDGSISPSPLHCFGLNFFGCLFFGFLVSLFPNPNFFPVKPLYFRRYNKGNSTFHVLPQRTSGLFTWHCNRYCSAIAILYTYGNMPFNEHLEDDNGPCTHEVQHGGVYISLTWIDWIHNIYFIILTTLWLLILLCWECF